MQCLPVSTRITPQCLFGSYSRSFKDSFFPEAAAEGVSLVASGGGDCPSVCWPLLLLGCRREVLIESLADAKKLQGDSDTDRDELPEELEADEELPLMPDLLSLIFSDPEGLAPLVPFPPEELELELGGGEFLFGSEVAAAAAFVAFVTLAAFSEELKSWKLLGTSAEEVDEVVVSLPAPPLPPVPIMLYTLDVDELELSAPNFRALTDTLHGVMRVAKVEGSPETPAPVLCLWMCLRSPWGFTAPLQRPQTTTMKGSVSGNAPYSPISLAGIRMTCPRVAAAAFWSGEAAADATRGGKHT